MIEVQNQQIDALLNPVEQAQPKKVEDNQLAQTMNTGDHATCLEELDPTYSDVLYDLRGIFNQYAGMTNLYGESDSGNANNRNLWSKRQLDEFQRDYFGLQPDLWKSAKAKNLDPSVHAFLTDASVSVFYNQVCGPWSFKKEFDFDAFLTMRQTWALMNNTDLDGITDKITGMNTKKIVSVNFNYANKFTNTGGSGGTRTETITYTTGRSSQEEITRSSSYAVEAAAEISYGIFTGSLSASASWDFNSFNAYSHHYEQTYTEELEIDLEFPAYVYEKSVTIYYADGTQARVGLGKYISDEPVELDYTVNGCEFDQSTL